MTEERTIPCPFCDEKTIKTIYTPPLRRTASKSYGSKGGTIVIGTPEKYEVLSGCSNCRKSRKEVEKKIKEPESKPPSHKEILKRLKEAELPTKV